MLILWANALTLWGQSRLAVFGDSPMRPNAVTYMDEFVQDVNSCNSNQVVVGSMSGVAFSVNYDIKSRGNAFGPNVSRTVRYEYFLQDPNGSETKVETKIEPDAGGQVGGDIALNYGGSGEVPLSLPSGKYRVKLVTSYEFQPAPTNGTRLTVKSKKVSVISTRFDAFPPPNYTDIVVDENFFCFEFRDCQSIGDIIVNYEPTGDFLYAPVTPASNNYVYTWEARVFSGTGATTTLQQNANHGGKVLCGNPNPASPNSTNYILTVYDPTTTCEIKKGINYDGRFNADANIYIEEGRNTFGPIGYLRREGFGASDYSRLESYIRNFGDGSPQLRVDDLKNRQLNGIGYRHSYPMTPIFYYTTYNGYYELITTNGCRLPKVYTEVTVPDPQGYAPAEDKPTEEVREKTTISPNPVSGTLNVKLKTGENLESIEIANTRGQVIYNLKGNGESTKDVDMQGFMNGIYILRVKNTEGDVKTLKIVKN